jgi:LPXTG-site transpeptidase (sortase) family protein
MNPKDDPIAEHLGPRKKVIEPLSSPGKSTDPNPAVDMIRGKIATLFGDEPDAAEELAETTVTPPDHRSKHQQVMQQLSTSGKSLADIQTAWHEYYVSLPEAEKHQVWQEFYAEHNRVDQGIKQAREDTSDNKPLPKVHPPQQSAAVAAEPARQHPSHTKPKRPHDLRSVADVQQQIVGKIKQRATPKNPHVRSLLFGLSMGCIVVVVLLFGFFNERIIAPFITPSRTVSSTAIITDPTSTPVGKESKIIIPKINVEIPVVYDEPSIQEEAMQAALERGVVHYATTPNPGEKGNAVIFGHSSNNILNSGKYKFAFVLLSRLQEEDTFMLERGGQRYVYKVFEKKVVKPTDLSVLGSSDRTATATLITCDPPGTSINRLVVVGEQISPSPTGNVASTATPEAVATENETLPSNSPSLWSRITNWF